MRYSLLAVSLLFSALGAQAQLAEFGVHGGVSRLRGENLGTLSTGQAGGVVSVALDDGWRFGFRMTLNNWKFFGHEFGYAYNRSKLRFSTDPQAQGMAIHQGMYNFLVYALPEGSPVRPFLTGGGHFSNFTPPGTSVTSGGGSTKIGVNYGGGIKFKISPMFGVRFDVRDYVTGKPFDLPNASGALRQLEVSAGFSVLL